VLSVISSAGLPEIPGLEIAAWKGTPALTRRPQRVAGPGWFAVGDAAGYVEPFTGEGMAWAIGGALALAPIAIRSLALGSDAGIREWTRSHARLIGRRQWSCRLLARLLRSPRASRWLIAALSVAPGLAGPVVRGLNRPPRLSRSMP
jgi:flavin-dependent dehydrogenase